MKSRLPLKLVQEWASYFGVLKGIAKMNWHRNDKNYIFSQNFVRRFQCKVRREDIFKPTIGNESLYEISNDNGVKNSELCHIQKLIVKSIMSSHHDIHKFIWTCPDRKTHNQIDHILIDMRQHSSILDVWLFRAGDCDTGSEKTMHRVRMERFNLKKLNGVEGKEPCHILISNRLAALENLDTWGGY
jgi:hypothetical protein